MNAEDVFYYSKLSQLGIEEWVSIPGYEGSHEVSNLGQVRSLDRVVSEKKSAKRVLTSRKLKGKIMKPTKDKRGRGYVDLRRQGNRNNRAVHCVVMEAFVSAFPKGLEVCHNNGDNSDNRLFNLRYDTHRNNMLDKNKHGTLVRGEAHYGSKLSNEQVVSIKKLLSRGELLHKDIAQEFGVSPSIIGSIYRGQTWKHV